MADTSGGGNSKCKAFVCCYEFGAGKSTLARLIQGFYVPSEGSIEIDARDIRQLTANELRNQLGVVPQETLLFAGSVFENLQLANPHALFPEIVQACKMAEIHDTIEKLPKGSHPYAYAGHGGDSRDQAWHQKRDGISAVAGAGRVS